MLRTRQVAGIAELVECLRHISSEVVMHFTPSGLQICELTATNALYISVLLQSERFESYQGTGSVRVGCMPLHGALKAITRQVARQRCGKPHDGMLEMRVGRNCVALSLSSDGTTTAGDSPDMLYELPAVVLSATTAAEMLTSAVARRELLMRPDSFGSIMYMNARHLSHLVSHVLPLGDVVAVICSGDKVDFEVINRHSDITSVRVSFREAIGSEAAGDRDPSIAHRSVFRQPLFTMLLRSMSQHTTSTLMLPRTPQNPAMMQAVVSDLGTLSIAIAQIDDPVDEMSP